MKASAHLPPETAMNGSMQIITRSVTRHQPNKNAASTHQVHLPAGFLRFDLEAVQGPNYYSDVLYQAHTQMVALAPRSLLSVLLSGLYTLDCWINCCHWDYLVGINQNKLALRAVLVQTPLVES